MGKLNSFTDDQLQQELRRRADERRRSVKEVRVANWEALKKVLTPEVISALTPHSYTTCSDADPRNYSRPCARCLLIEVQQGGYDPVPPEHLVFDFTIHIREES